MARRMGLSTILLIAAVVCFVLALFKVNLGDLELVTLGLALFAGAFLPGSRPRLTGELTSSTDTGQPAISGLSGTFLG